MRNDPGGLQSTGEVWDKVHGRDETGNAAQSHLWVDRAVYWNLDRAL